jgi:hypothetical protein
MAARGALGRAPRLTDRPAASLSRGEGNDQVGPEIGLSIIVVANEPSYDQPSDRIEQEVVKRETIAQHFSACRSEDTPDVRIAVFAIPGSC